MKEDQQLINSMSFKLDITLLANTIAFKEACLRLALLTDSSLETITLSINESVQDKLNRMSDAELMNAIATMKKQLKV